MPQRRPRRRRVVEKCPQQQHARTLVFDAQSETYGDLVEPALSTPTKDYPSALQNAASHRFTDAHHRSAGQRISWKEEKNAGGGHGGPPGGGMGGGMY